MHDIQTCFRWGIMLKGTGLARLGEDEEVAKPIAFLVDKDDKAASRDRWGNRSPLLFVFFLQLDWDYPFEMFV